MTDESLSRVSVLAFDIFGTVLDLTGSLLPPTETFLRETGAPVDARTFWDDWRARQRIEQYQDNLLLLGHSGYLETCRRAFIYCLRLHGIAVDYPAVERFMEVYMDLQPFPDAVVALPRLARRYSLVALSNGEQWFLEHLAANNIKVDFRAIISVEQVGAFKPFPAVYRRAAQTLNLEPPEIMMVAAHSFDILGARACGFRGAYVNRYGLPTEESPYQPDLVARDFLELADLLAP